MKENFLHNKKKLKKQQQEIKLNDKNMSDVFNIKNITDNFL